MATDKEIRDKGYYYIPPQKYLTSPFEIPNAPDGGTDDNVGTGGIVDTNAFNDSENIYLNYDDKIGASGASPFLNMSQLNYPIGNPDTVIAPGVRLGGDYLPPGTTDFNRQLFETGPYADPYKRLPENTGLRIDPELVEKLRENNPELNDLNFSDAQIMDNYSSLFRNVLPEDQEEEEQFNLMDYIPFVGKKSAIRGIMSAMLPKQDSRFTDIRSYYGGGDNLDSIGRIQSGLMAGYSPVHGGFLNTITGGRYGSPTSYGLQRAYQKRIDTINKTEKRKGGLSKELKERREKLREEKAAELRALQTAQAKKDYNTIQDAYETQTGAGSSYSGGDDTREARSTGNYHDPFDPGHAD